MRVRLVSIDKKPHIDLEKEITVIGRGPECDVKIEDKSVSKLHCVLVRNEGVVLLRDLGSTNGTRVNGRRVRRAALLPEDNLAIAAFRYRIRFGELVDGPIDAAGPEIRLPEATAEDEEGTEQVTAMDESQAGSHRVNFHPDEYPDSGPSKIKPPPETGR